MSRVAALAALRRGLRAVAACAAVTLFAALGARSEAATCLNNPLYTVSIANTDVFSIDPQNGFAVTQAPGAAPFISAAAARDPANGLLYMVGFRTTAGTVPFGSYDPTSGANTTTTLTGINAADFEFVRAGFSQNGTMYVESANTQTLYSVTTAGVATAVGTLTGLPVSTGDLAFDPVNPNVFYASDVNAAENGGNGAIDIYKGTLGPLAVTELGDSGINTKTVYGLAFGNNGVLYAEDESTSTLYSINETTGLATAATTSVSAVTGGIYDLASVPQAANLTVVKKHTNVVKAGGPIDYTITVSNAANATCTLTSLTLTDPLPAELSAPTYTPATGTYNSTTGAWTGLSIAPGGSTTLAIVATVASTANGSTIANTATVSAPGVQNIATSTTSTDLAPLASLTKSVLNITTSPTGTPVTSNIVLPGQKLRYFITFTNNTSVALVNPAIADTIPAHTTYSAESCPAASTTLPTGVTCAFSPAAPVTGGPITYQFTGTLAAGATVEVSLDVTVI